MAADVQTPADVDVTPSVPEPGRMRLVLAGAVVGGLCGALVTAGAFVAFDDDGGTTAVGTTDSPEISREASTIPEGDIAAVIARVQPAVVAVTTSTTGGGPGGGEGAGTGFVIAADGVIVTNNHVVAETTDIEVAFSDGRTLAAEIVGRDSGADLAVLKVDAAALAVVELGDSDAVQVGDDVIAIGNALALEGGLSVTQGIISGPPREIGTEIGTVLESVIQTDAAINRGNSGGPLVDATGRVIGINTAIADPAVAQNVGFAIPISHALPIIEDLRSGRVPAFLGVVTDNADNGAVVVNVTDDSPAAQAGIREGDVIVAVGGDEIADAGDVPKAIRKHRPGDEVDVVVVRDDERVTVQATLVERPDSG
ncbi:MAG TPA: trypsin-like peptidase domain-containing protein [Acidimicrobiia bacterium]|nr:trypsin-like peptidase domain-containing protein [Acidimicrobiia bacterium]